jgi:photosystem II stability/assembly factor-like uncharacterized protein
MAERNSPDTQSPIAEAIAGLGLRSIGPAFMGGRVVDIAIHPSEPSTWLVAVGSGGVWKTTNAGITWRPIFDDQPSYSIGCVRIDPSNPNNVWVGTGEAVNGRHVAWGDGVYRSVDGGDSWAHMGLQQSEHVADILIDPRDSNVVFVAAEGPLWSSGGERGLYKTTDGGEHWELVLHVDDDTGVTSAVFAPDDPDTVTVATYQRRRRAWSFLAGGPGSGIHQSTDGGATFEKMTAGLPDGDMGRIGLAVSPAAPHVVYATIEAVEKKERGFYRSTNRGRTWERRSEYLSGGTGPHYYQKIFASPVDADTVYTADVFIHATKDGGATFTNLETGKQKHSDNHVVWIDPLNGQHLIVGTDAGLYETFDDGGAWRHVSNLPISQFYRVAVDDSLPFANVLGGAQDLGTIHGPTRTLHVDGVRNKDWWVPLGADGYHVAFDPTDGDLSYMEWQIGNVMRHDKRTMELTDIQPQPGPDDPPERWNWDTPIVVSTHVSGRVYVASQRVWRSDDRGDSWEAISPDLTTGVNRYELPMGERVVSVDSLYDQFAMSHYATISILAESTMDAALLYAGTDDGRIHVSEDGGAGWREATRPAGLPDVAFINGIEPSRHDASVVFLAADDHKSGDFTPYVFRSDDRGRTWVDLSDGLPQTSIVWTIKQDHVRPELLFVGAEHGVHITVDGGNEWHQLSNDVPTISFRDLALQRRDDDLICASFGRGFYVLDDYSVLRHLDGETLGQEVSLFPVRDAWWYVPYRPMQANDQPTLGSTSFRSSNPEFGASFTYHLTSELLSAKGVRREHENERDDADVAFPGWDELREEQLQGEPILLLLVRDANGEAVRSIVADHTKGLHRTSWDLRYAAPDPVKLEAPGFQPPWATNTVGALVPTGTYTVEVVRRDATGETRVAGPESFVVRPIPTVADGAAADDSSFRLETSDLVRRVRGASADIDAMRSRLLHVRKGLTQTPAAAHLVSSLEATHRSLEDVAVAITGDPIREAHAEPAQPSIREQADRVSSTHWGTTGPPTDTQRAVLSVAAERFEAAVVVLDGAREMLRNLTDELDSIGGPWVPR